MKLDKKTKKLINVVDDLTKDNALACLSFLKKTKCGKKLIPQNVYFKKDVYYGKNTFLKNLTCILKTENKNDIADTMWFYVPMSDINIKFDKKNVLNW